MHSTIHAVCGQQKGKNRAKSHVLLFKKKIIIKIFSQKGRASFRLFQRAGRHEKGAGRRALQKKPRQNTGLCDVNYTIIEDTLITKWVFVIYLKLLVHQP